MKKIGIVFMTLGFAFGLISSIEAQTSYKDLADHFIKTWQDKAGEWDHTKNLQIVVYGISAALSLLSITLDAKKKGPPWLTISLAVAVGLCTQASWLFDIQPKKYAWASKMVKFELDNFKYSLYGQDLTNSSITSSYLDQQQKLEEKFKKIELWLIGDQNETALPPATTQLNNEEHQSFSFASFHDRTDLNQCLETQYDFSRSNIIIAGTNSFAISQGLRKQINTDESSIYMFGVFSSTDVQMVALGASECARQSLSRFLQNNSTGHAKSLTNAEEISRGVINQSEVVFLKFLQQESQYACLKIYRVSKGSLNSYFSNVNSLMLRDPRIINKDFKEKLIKTRAIKD